MDSQNLGQRVAQVRHDRGWTQTELADRIRRYGYSMSQAGIAKIEMRGDVRPRGLREIAKALGVSENWLLTGRGSRDLAAEPITEETKKVPIAGYVGAGGTIVFQDAYAKGAGFDLVDAPPDEHRSVVAVAVRGTSQLPFYRDGDVVYFTREPPFAPSDLINEQCVVRLAEPDGRTLLKVIKPGSKARRFTLASFNEEDITDVYIEWAAPILWIKRQPRAPAHRSRKA